MSLHPSFQIDVMLYLILFYTLELSFPLSLYMITMRVVFYFNPKLFPAFSLFGTYFVSQTCLSQRSVSQTLAFISPTFLLVCHPFYWFLLVFASQVVDDPPVFFFFSMVDFLFALNVIVEVCNSSM